MRRNLQIGVILAGSGLFLLSGGAVMAQPPGSPQTPTGQQGRTAQPGATNPTTAQPSPVVTGEPLAAQAKVDDKKFAHDAALGGMTEVELGKLAAEKGSSEGVKQFGQKLVDDHSKANEELKKVASAQSITLPDSLDAKHKSRVDKMSKLSGTQFDKAFIKDQIKDHEQDLREFRNESQNGSNPEVKDFAAKTLPTLQEHLTMAKDLNSGKNTSKAADADRSQQ